MAAQIGPKIGVQGEAEYRSEMARIIEKTKALEAEMRTLQSTTTDEANAEELARQKAEKLNDIIASQKERVALLAEQLEKSKEKTGENSTETSKYRTQLANAKTVLNTLEAQTGEATTATQKFSEAEDAAGKNALSMGDLIKSNLISDAIVSGLKTLASLAKSAADALWGTVTSAADYADEFQTMSSVTGVSTTMLQQLAYMAELVDVSLDTITGSLSKVTKSMSSARSGSKTAAAAFNKLGIQITNADGSLRSSEAVFYEAIDALGRIENETERDALSMEIFGKSAKELNPLIKAGTAGMAAYAKEAQEVGYVLDEKTIGKLGELDDSFQRLKNVRTAISNRLGAALAPSVTKVVDKLIEFADRVDWDKIAAAIGRLLDTASARLIALMEGLDFDKLADGALKLTEGIINGMTWILDHADEIIKLVRDIGIGLIAGKAVNGVSNLVGAGKTVFGGLSRAVTGGAGAATSGATAAGGSSLLSGLGLAALPAVLLGFGAYGGVQNIKSRKSAVSEGLADLEEYAGAEIHTLEEMFQLRNQLNREYANAVEAVNTETIASTLEGYEGDLNAFIAAEDAAQARYQQSLTMIAEWLGTDEETAAKIYNAWLKVQKMQDEVDTAQANYEAKQTKKTQKRLDDAEVELSDAQAALAEILAYYQVDLSAGLDTSSMDELPGQAYAWGDDMMRSMAAGIVSGANSALIPAAVGAAKALWSIFHHSEPETGPLADDSEWMPDMMKSMAAGIRENSYLVRDAMSALAYDLSDTMGGVRGGDSISYGGVTVVFQVQPGQDGRALFDEFSAFLADGITREGAVYA